MKERGTRVINGGPIRALGGCWRGVSSCDTISGGPMGVEGRGSLFLFQRQDKQGNESIIISRNCLPLCLSSPGLPICLHSLAGHGLIKEFHCPQDRQKERMCCQPERYIRYGLCFYCCPGPAALFLFHVTSVHSPMCVLPCK